MRVGRRRRDEAATNFLLNMGVAASIDVEGVIGLPRKKEGKERRSQAVKQLAIDRRSKSNLPIGNPSLGRRIACAVGQRNVPVSGNSVRSSCTALDAFGGRRRDRVGQGSNGRRRADDRRGRWVVAGLDAGVDVDGLGRRIRELRQNAGRGGGGEARGSGSRSREGLFVEGVARSERTMQDKQSESDAMKQCVTNQQDMT